jgi:hypothetical protein
MESLQSDARPVLGPLLLEAEDRAPCVPDPGRQAILATLAAKTGSVDLASIQHELAATVDQAFEPARVSVWVTGRASRLIPGGAPARLGQDPAGDPVSVPQAS